MITSSGAQEAAEVQVQLEEEEGEMITPGEEEYRQAALTWSTALDCLYLVVFI